MPGVKHNYQSGTANSGAAEISSTRWNEAHAIADTLEFPNTPSPATPAASTLAIFGLKTAERMVPAFLGPAGAKWPVQVSLGSAIAAWFSPPGNVAGVGNVVGFTSPTATGTLTARNVATTNFFTRRHRAGYVSAATAAALAGLRFPAASYQTGDGAAGSGFFLAFEFGASDAATVAGARMFAGMSASVAAPTNVEPSTLVNVIGVGHGAADTNLKLFFGGTTAQTPIDLGVNFPVNTLSVDWYRVVLYAPSSLTGTVYYEVTRMNTGHVATGTLSGAAAVLPAAAVLLNAMNSYRTNNATALAVGLDHGIIYAEQGT